MNHPLLDAHHHTNERHGSILYYRNGVGWQALAAGAVQRILKVVSGLPSWTTLTSASPTDGIGYSTGAGGAVTQPISKSTGVTLNTICGQITMNAAALVAGTEVTFTVTDSACAATDLLIVNHASGGTVGSYLVGGSAAAGSFRITVSNASGGDLSEAIVLSFAILKAVTA